MNSIHWSPIALALALLWPAAAESATSAALDSLVASERAFARMSAEKGVRDAFLAYLAADGVIFRPRPTNGRQAWESRGPVAARLAWEPVFAEVATAGDLGYTTGPWELRPDDPQHATGYGHFVSIWQRQADGTWRVGVDIGITHAQPRRGLGNVEFTPGPLHAAAARAAVATDLAALDREWTREARAKDPAATFARWAAADVRFYRDRVEPVLGLRGAREMMRAIVGTTAWNPDGQRISSSDDLGCTWGILERRASASAAPDSSVYLHVWRRGTDRRWKVALALENPLPKSEGP